MSVFPKRATVMDLDRDSLYFIRQCSDCWDGFNTVGQAHVPSGEPY
jgi:hypothetical protein